MFEDALYITPRMKACIAVMCVLLLIGVCVVVYWVFFRRTSGRGDKRGVLTEQLLGDDGDPAGQSPSSQLYAPCTAKMTNAQAIRLSRDAIRQNPAYSGDEVFITEYDARSTRGLSAASGVIQVKFLRWKVKETPVAFVDKPPESWALKDVPKSATGPIAIMISFHDEACGAYMVDALAAREQSQDWCMDYRTRVLATCNKADITAPTKTLSSLPLMQSTQTTPTPTIKASPLPPCENFWKDPNWRTLAQSDAFIDTYVRRGKWRGSDPLPASVSVTLLGLAKWDLSASLRAEDSTTGFATNHGIMLKYRIIDPATQRPPAGLDETEIVEFRVLATIDDTDCSSYKILMFNR
jgi:hypothetical protein